MSEPWGLWTFCSHGRRKVSCRELDAPVGKAQRLLHLAFFPERDYPSCPQSVSSLSDQRGSDERSAVLNSRSWDFPGGPVAKSLPCSAGHVRSLSGWGAKTPHASEQLSLPAALETLGSGIEDSPSSASSPRFGPLETLDPLLRLLPRVWACLLLAGPPPCAPGVRKLRLSFVLWGHFCRSPACQMWTHPILV